MIRIYHFLIVFCLFFSFTASAQTDAVHQWSTGMMNLSYKDHIYYTLTNNPAFVNGNGPQSLGTNVNYQYVVKFAENEVVDSWSIGGEFALFQSTSSSVYADEGPAGGPSIDMTMYTPLLQVRLNFTPAFDGLFSPYLGVGWGMMLGQFDIDDGTNQSKVNFSGPLAYQAFGAMVELDASYGFLFEFRTFRANQMTIYRDHFGVSSSGAPFKTDFSGAFVNLIGYYRF